MYSLEEIRAAGLDFLPQLRKRQRKVWALVFALVIIPLAFSGVILVWHNLVSHLPWEVFIMVGVPTLLVFGGTLISWWYERNLGTEEESRFHQMLQTNVKESLGIQNELSFTDSIPFITGETDRVNATFAVLSEIIYYKFEFLSDGTATLVHKSVGHYD